MAGSGSDTDAIDSLVSGHESSKYPEPFLQAAAGRPVATPTDQGKPHYRPEWRSNRVRSSTEGCLWGGAVGAIPVGRRVNP